MRVEDIPLKSIRVEERYREDMGDINQLAETMREKGLVQPISVDQNYKLLAGGRRFAAAELLGWHTIPSVIHTVKTKLSALEIELLENVERKDMEWHERAKLEKRIWDMKVEDDPKWSQRKQAEYLDEANGTVARRLQLAEALQTLPELSEYKTEDEAWKELKALEEEVVHRELQRRATPEVIDASKWAADNYKVGDAFAGMKDIRADLVHFAEVDPPYGVEIDRRKGRNKDTKNIAAYNEIDADEYIAFLEKAAKETFRILKADSFAVFWYGMTWHSEVLEILRKTGFGVPDIPAIWYKGPVGQTASPDTTFGSCYEPFFLARKGKPKMVRSGHDNVFHFNKLPASRKIHITEKPIELLEEILGTVCWPGSTIMCPFLGSGVTLRAAYKLGHKGFGWDLSERNKELFIRKVRGEIVENALGEEATD